MRLFLALALNIVFSVQLWTASAKLRDGDCEVCIKFLTNFDNKLTSEDRGDKKLIQQKLEAACGKSKKKENRFCYYIGGTEDAATGTLKEVVEPLSYHMPPEKICEKLKKRDAQICELQYDKQIDLKSVDFKKLRVKELKKILSDFEEECVGCLEKSDFVKKIQEVMKEHTEL